MPDAIIAKVDIILTSSIAEPLFQECVPLYHYTVHGLQLCQNRDMPFPEAAYTNYYTGVDPDAARQVLDAWDGFVPGFIRFVPRFFRDRKTRKALKTWHPGI